MRKYRLIKKRGEGTFSEVIQASKGSKQFAIKCMKSQFKTVDQVNNLREIQALRRLMPHPNIVRLEEVLYDKPTGRLALVFELMDMNLYELIRGRRHHLDAQLVKIYAFQSLRSLAHLHSKGIFHRDIKPENILIESSYDVYTGLKLADFGSCRGIRSKQPFTEYISTRWYRAPECLLTDGWYGGEMDIWGLGCVLFEISALFPLFPGQNEKDQVAKIHKVLGTPQEAELEFFRKHQSRHMSFNFPVQKGSGLTKLAPNLPKPFLDLLTQMLAYDPRKRITAQDALKHEYFDDLRATPLPSEIKTIEEQHRKREAQRARHSISSRKSLAQSITDSQSIVSASETENLSARSNKPTKNMVQVKTKKHGTTKQHSKTKKSLASDSSMETTNPPSDKVSNHTKLQKHKHKSTKPVHQSITEQTLSKSNGPTPIQVPSPGAPPIISSPSTADKAYDPRSTRSIHEVASIELESGVAPQVEEKYSSTSEYGKETESISSSKSDDNIEEKYDEDFEDQANDEVDNTSSKMRKNGKQFNVGKTHTMSSFSKSQIQRKPSHKRLHLGAKHTNNLTKHVTDPSNSQMLYSSESKRSGKHSTLDNSSSSPIETSMEKHSLNHSYQSHRTDSKLHKYGSNNTQSYDPMGTKSSHMSTNIRENARASLEMLESPTVNAKSVKHGVLVDQISNKKQFGKTSAMSSYSNSNRNESASLNVLTKNKVKDMNASGTTRIHRKPLGSGTLHRLSNANDAALEASYSSSFGRQSRESHHSSFDTSPIHAKSTRSNHSTIHKSGRTKRMLPPTVLPSSLRGTGLQNNQPQLPAAEQLLRQGRVSTKHPSKINTHTTTTNQMTIHRAPVRHKLGSLRSPSMQSNISIPTATRSIIGPTAHATGPSIQRYNLKASDSNVSQEMELSQSKSSMRLHKTQNAATTERQVSQLTKLQGTFPRKLNGSSFNSSTSKGASITRQTTASSKASSVVTTNRKKPMKRGNGPNLSRIAAQDLSRRRQPVKF